MRVYIFKDRFYVCGKPAEVLKALREYSRKYTTVVEILRSGLH